MSIRVVGWVLYKAPVTSPTDLLVLLVIADRAGDDGAGVWYSVATLAELARLSRRTVQTSLSRLESDGLIMRDRRKGRTSAIRIVLPRGAHGAHPRSARAAQGGANGAQKGRTTFTRSVKDPSLIREEDELQIYDQGIVES